MSTAGADISTSLVQIIVKGFFSQPYKKRQCIKSEMHETETQM